MPIIRDLSYMAMRERLKDAALDVGLGRKYGHTGDATQDCSRFTYATLSAAFPLLVWGLLHKTLHLNFDGALRSTANVTAVRDLLNSYMVEDPMHGYWHYCQGWKRNKGHNFFWWRPEAAWESQPSMILDATDGTDDWYRPETWAERRTRYDIVALCTIS